LSTILLASAGLVPQVTVRRAQLVLIGWRTRVRVLNTKAKGKAMIAIIKRAIGPFAVALTAACPVALAAPSPLGVWLDNTGRGAVEITDCGGKLCGRLVWFKDPTNAKDGCNFQIIGDVKPVGSNTWDGGWIVDPEKNPDKKYDVEITAVSDQKLKVMGYAGMKFMSETMVWTRAPANLVKCGASAANTPEPARVPSPDDARAPAAPAPSRTPEKAKPDKAADASSKRCKVDLSFAVVTFPCQD
jgi:uncharacterized protein (DUF2147 family)